MNKTNKFLLKIFCVALTFLCNFYNDAICDDIFSGGKYYNPLVNSGNASLAQANSSSQQVSSLLEGQEERCTSSYTGTDMAAMMRSISNAKCKIYTTTNESKGTKKILCKQGEYLNSCGNYTLGYNTLMSTTVDGTTTTDFTDGCQDKAKCMRLFFRGPKEVDSADLFGNNDVFIKNRDDVLGAICSPETASYTCVKCPNNGTVEESTVEIASDDGLVRKSFVIHTIIDCYQNTFEDNTGTYVYKGQVVDPQPCFYPQDNIPEGTKLKQLSTSFSTNLLQQAGKTQAQVANATNIELIQQIQQ